MDEKLGLVAYETQFAPCGGIAAVMRFLPQALAAAAGQRVAVFTPLHHAVPQARNLGQLPLAAVFGLPLGSRTVTINLRHRADDDLDWYFVGTDQPDLFGGRPDPYGVGEGLTRDALVFGAAVARVIWMLAPGQPWRLHLADWQAATTALAMARGGSVAPHRLQLALHNSYDAGLKYYDLNQVGIQPMDCPPIGPPEISTVLTRALPLVNRKVCTVSRQFAKDLVEEPLHARILAEHLRAHLADRLIGVDNGRFAEPSLPTDLLEADPEAGAGDLVVYKRQRWQQAVAALLALPDSPQQPVWGDRHAFGKLAADGALAPLLMGGRDDPQQKGYDVLAEAAERLLSAGCPAQFVFLPMPGPLGLAALDYLRALAERWPGRVLALPFRFSGYMDLLAGAAYGLMPSLYEPFGAANEFYLAGTPCIARATGGLAQQIVPAPVGRAVPIGVRRFASAWHAKGAGATGFLYREDDGLSADPGAWWHLRQTLYRPGQGEGRGASALFASMVEALGKAIEAAVQLWAKTPERYGAMALRGTQLILREYTWERAATEYLAAFED